MLKTKIIETYQEFLALKDPWNELVSRSDLDHVYMKHEWFDCWIRSFSVASNLCIPVVFRDSQLCAVAPLYRLNTKIKSLPIKSLTLLQSGISPRCNFLVKDPEDLNILLDQIHKLPAWDILVAEKLETNKAVTQYIHELINSSSKFSLYLRPGRLVPVLNISGEWKDYLTTLSRKRRKYLKQSCENKLNRANDFELISIEDYTDYDKAIALMMDISSKSWKHKEGTSIPKMPAQYNFYKEFTKIGLQNKWIGLNVLTINGAPAAFDYYLKLYNSHAYIRSDFDLEYSDYNPGENLRYNVIKDHFQNHEYLEYDFVGNPTKFKQSWANNVKEHVDLFFINNTLKGQFIAFSLNNIKPLWNKLTAIRLLLYNRIVSLPFSRKLTKND